MAGALARLGVDRALVVSSEDGLDEMSTSAPTHVVEVDGEHRALRRRPGGRRARADAPEAVPGGTPDGNAATTRAILAGEPGAARDLAVLNAGAAIYAAGRADSLQQGVDAAREAVDSGAAARTTDAYLELSRQLADRVNVLERIVDATRDEVARRRRARPAAELEQRARHGARTGRSRRRSPGRASRSSPSTSAARRARGRSARDATVVDIVGAYERGGAAALSILTEGRHFGGSLDDLREARAASALPILRKDFVVDPYQLYESTAAGADAILLIVAALDDDELSGCTARRSGSTSTSSSRSTTRRSSSARWSRRRRRHRDQQPRPHDFTVDIERTFELLPDVPAGKTVVSESGFHSREQLDELERVGVDAVLVGEALMRAPDIEAACRALTGVEGDPEAL